MSRYGRLHRGEETKHLVRVGSVPRNKWPYVAGEMGLPNGDIQAGGSRNYSWTVGDNNVSVRAEFGPVDVYVSSNAERRRLREILRTARLS